MMTQCERTEERLQRLLDGELDAGAIAETQAHLAGCPACRQEWAALQATRQALACWETPVVSPDVSVRFAERVTARRRARGGIWRWAAWTTSAAAVLALSLQLLTPHSPRVTRPVTRQPLPVTRLVMEAQPSPTPAPAVAARPAAPAASRRAANRPRRHTPAPPPATPHDDHDVTLAAVNALAETPESAVMVEHMVVTAGDDASDAVNGLPGPVIEDPATPETYALAMLMETY